MTDENDEIDEDGIKQRWERVGSKLDVHDFADKELGKAVPYGALSASLARS